MTPAASRSATSRTVGVDLSAQPTKTALAVVDWRGHQARVDAVRLGCADDVLLGWLIDRDVTVGIDCPFGWPVPFIDFVAAHQAHTLTADADPQQDWKHQYLFRRTDRFVRERDGLIPLSVAADRIAHPTMRLANLLAQVEPDRAARDGSGGLAEMYPAAALKRWGLPHTGYKGNAQDARNRRDQLVSALAERTPWLSLGRTAALCRESDDALDAVLCALIARCVATSRTLPAPAELREVVAAEGWIHLPTVPLEELGGSA